MSDFTMRDQAPLTAQEWEAFDEVVVRVARRTLVSRRFLSIVGPLGAGVQSIASDSFEGAKAGQISLFAAEEEEDAVSVHRRRFVPVPLLHCDFVLNWRDLETARQLGLPLETTAAAIAASAVAKAEDQLIFHGHDELEQRGFLNADERQQLPLGDWSVSGAAFGAIVNAVEALVAANLQPPFTVIVPPQLFVLLNRVFDNTGVLEIEQVRRLVGGGVFMSPAMPPNTTVVVSPGPESMHLTIAQDLTVAFLETTSMEHRFRVLEALSLQIKQPRAVVVLE
jgi:uncharacterized linocin/CFP29 family protein